MARAGERKRQSQSQKEERKGTDRRGEGVKQREREKQRETVEEAGERKRKRFLITQPIAKSRKEKEGKKVAVLIHFSFISSTFPSRRKRRGEGGGAVHERHRCAVMKEVQMRQHEPLAGKGEGRMHTTHKRGRTFLQAKQQALSRLELVVHPRTAEYQLLFRPVRPALAPCASSIPPSRHTSPTTWQTLHRASYGEHPHHTLGHSKEGERKTDRERSVQNKNRRIKAVATKQIRSIIIIIIWESIEGREGERRKKKL